MDETACDNTEGFYGVTTNIDYNIVSTTIQNIYNIPEYVTKKYTITDKGFRAIKDQVIIKAPSGILIREEATIASKIVGSTPDLDTFNYLSCGYETDSIFENGKYLKNYWLKVARKDSFTQAGYVFGAFTKRHIGLITNEYNVFVDEISTEDFYSEEGKKTSRPTIEKISDINEINKILENKLIGNNNEYGDYIIEKIQVDNGKVHY